MIKHIGIIINRIAIILLLVFSILIFVGSIYSISAFFIIAIIILVTSTALMIYVNRCPNCKTYFRGLFWSKKKVGYCTNCGKYIEFEDKVD